MYQEDPGEDEDADLDEDEFNDGFGNAAGRRRSQRTSTRNANGKRNSDALGEWRGERRSSRLGSNNDAISDGPSTKRARTEERSASSAPSDTLVSPVLSSNGTLPKKGAASVRPNEVVVEQLAGKKKSKFWFYAVEPTAESAALGGATIEAPLTNGVKPELNGYQNGDTHETIPAGRNGVNGMVHQSSQSPSMAPE